MLKIEYVLRKTPFQIGCAFRSRTGIIVLLLHSVSECLSLRRNWVPPPSPASECGYPPWTQLGSDTHYTLTRSEGGGGPSPTNSELRLPHPLFRKRVRLPPPPPPPGSQTGRDHTRLRVRGWWSPHYDDWRKSLAICLLCDFCSIV